MEKPFLSIIIPAYNEEKNLEKGVLDEVVGYLKGVKYSYEVIIVDDGSTDKTAALVRDFSRDRMGFHLIENQHGGKALAVMTGLLAAKGDIALFTDMDQATPIIEVEKFFPYFEGSLPADQSHHEPYTNSIEKASGKIRRGYDIVIGSRAGREGAPMVRRLAAWGFAVLRNIILGLPFPDTQCGFKAFNEKSRETIFSQMLKEWRKARVIGAAVHAGFDVETLFIARKKGFRIAAVPVAWHHVGTERVQLIRDSLDAIKDMIRIRWNNWIGKY